MMALKHGVFDSDKHFSINPVTRALKNEASSKTHVIQHDHNSERFTFEIPRIVEGHDMSKCDVIQVHYNNIDAITKEQNKGVYEVNDLQISKEDESVVVLSWLISGNATKFVGSLNFLIRFACTDDNGQICYVWNTAIYAGISVSSGIYNGDDVVDQYADILAEWNKELESNQIVDLKQTRSSAIDGGVNIWTATFGDGRTSNFEVRNGHTVGDAMEGDFVQTIRTVNGKPLRFFVGNNSDYNALLEEEKKDLFAVIEDDTTKDEIFDSLSQLNDDLFATREVVQQLNNNLADGSFIVGKAVDASHATTAGSAETATLAGDATKAYKVKAPKTSFSINSGSKWSMEVAKGKTYIVTISLPNFGGAQTTVIISGVKDSTVSYITSTIGRLIYNDNGVKLIDVFVYGTNAIGFGLYVKSTQSDSFVYYAGTAEIEVQEITLTE